MEPAFKAFTFRRGNSPGPFAVRLTGKDIRTGALVVVPRTGDVVSWSISWPGGAVTKTTAQGGGLLVDPRTKFIFWPLAQADVDAMGAGVVVPMRVDLTDEDGNKRTYLTGTLQAEG